MFHNGKKKGLFGTNDPSLWTHHLKKEILGSTVNLLTFGSIVPNKTSFFGLLLMLVFLFCTFVKVVPLYLFFSEAAILGPLIFKFTPSNFFQFMEIY